MIKLHDEIPMPGFALFPILFTDVLITNVAIVTMAANVYTRSTNILLNWQRSNGSRGQGKLERKIIKSCFRLKVRFGNSYVDKFTPCVIQNFCFIQTASLLIISK